MSEEREDISGNVAPREITRGGREIAEPQYDVNYLPNQAKENTSVLVPTEGSFKEWLATLPSINLDPFARLKLGSSTSYDISLFATAFKKNRVRVTAERGRNPYDYDQKLTMTYFPKNGRSDQFAKLTRLGKRGWIMEGLDHKLHLQK